MKINLSIIIVTYNSEKEIGILLSSIKKSSDRLNKEIIIIDNASQDKTVQSVKQNSQAVQLIESNNNLGFSKAVNLGIRKSKGEYIMLLNPDTRLIGNCLDHLYKFAVSKQKLGAVAPQLLDPNGRIQPSVFHFPTIVGAIRAYFLNQKEYFGKYLPKTSPAKVDVVVMAALMIPRKVIEKIGPLSERFFMYYEDIEYCRRLKKVRFSVYYFPKAKIEHVHGASGKFTAHLNSPLAKSAKIYHGEIYSNVLNFILWLGQKWQKLIRRIPR